MARNPPVIHGRDHLPGGADPIDFEKAGSLSAAPYQPLNVLLSSVFGFDDGWGSVTLDASVYGGGFRYQSAPADAKILYLPFIAGPQWSTWGITLVYKVGTDYGKLDIAYATSSEDGLHDAVGFEGPGMMQEPFDVTFINNSTTAVDAYSPAPQPDQVTERTGIFRIGGAPGDVLTAFTTDPLTAKPQGDGGPGLYWVRLKINGKNGSSSGYKFDLQYAAIERIPGG